MFRRVAVISLFAGVLLTLLPTQTFAATKSITLSPSSTALTVVPGVAANRNITIINDGDTPYTAKLSTSPYSVKGEQYDPVFQRLPGTKDIADWISLSQTSVRLQPHENAVIPYTITAPSATQPGGYYGVIFAETTSDANSGVSAQNKVGNILYVSVEGNVQQSGSVEAETIPFFTFGSSVPLGMKLTNSGGVHFQTEATFTARGITGKSVLEHTENRFVLPQTTRSIVYAFAPEGLGGIYKISRSATAAGKPTTLPDSWIIVMKPHVVPLILFALLTLVGIIIIFKKRSRKGDTSRKKKKA